MKKIRLDKFLCETRAAASRSQAKKFILKGYVIVNGKVIRDPSFKVDKSDEVFFENEILSLGPEHIYIILNKPAGYVSSTSDPNNPTVINLLFGAQKIEKLFPVGRLDKDVKGLLLITNDGQLAHKLTHPKYKVEKEYLVTIEGKVKKEDLEKILQGTEHFDKRKKRKIIYKPKDVKILKENEKETVLSLILTEGKYHEIKNIFKLLNYKIKDIKRIRFGPIKLENLPEGKWRYLSENEIKLLKEAVKR